MPQRDPRSPEPRGSHAFAGSIPSNRLNPTPVYEHPDPFSLGTLTVSTRLNVNDVYSISGDITFHNNIDFSAPSFTIGDGTNYLGTLWVQRLKSNTAETLNITVYDDLVPDNSGAGHTIGTSGLRWLNGYFTSLNVSGTATLVTATVTTLNVDNVRRINSGTTIGTSSEPFLGSYVTTSYMDNLDDRSAGWIDVKTDLNPHTSGAVSLGSASANRQFSSAHITTVNTGTLSALASSISVTETLLPSTADLGGSSNYWTNGYVTDLHVATLDDDGSGTIEVQADLIPHTAGAVSLGSASANRQFSSIHIDNVNVYNNVDMKENPLHGIISQTSAPALADMEIGEIRIGDTGSGATSGRIWVKANSGEVYEFSSDARIVT